MEKWIHNPNGRPRKTHEEIDGIIIHAMGETIGDRAAWNHLKSIGLSAHAFVTPSGVIVRSRSDDQVAWHAGPSVNARTLGIEVLAPGVFQNVYDLWSKIQTPYVSEAQYLATVWRVREWLLAYGPDVWVRKHSDFDAKKQDPGNGFPWARFLGDIRSC